MSDFEHSPEPASNSIEQTASKRAEFTRRFFNKQGPTALQEFADSLKKEPFQISIKPEDDKSLTLGVCELQKKLGFAQEDQPQGCDGKLGPYTYRHYQDKLLKAETHSNLDNLATASSPITATKAAAPQAASTLNEGREKTANSTKNTILVGDSVTVCYANKMPDAKKACKGGKSTDWMEKNFRAQYLQKNPTGKYELKSEYLEVKDELNLVLLGGVNDIMNGEKVGKIMNNLTSIAEKSAEAGIKNVAVCTLPKWDTERWSNFYKVQWQKWHKRDGGNSWNNGVYPYSGEMLATATERLNAEIRKLAGRGIKVIDLYNNMGEIPLVDGLHPSPKGSAIMAAYIKKETNILDRTA